MPYFSAIVEKTVTSIRLDKYIASLPNGLNRSKLKSGLHAILVNNEKAKLSSKVHAGDKIDIEWEDNVPQDIIPQDISLNIIYEDQNVTVVNKEQGMVTHPACGNWEGTLVNALLYHWGRNAVKISDEGTVQEILKKRRPGIVHRLDKDTSGIIIAAKNRESEEWLQTQFQKRRVVKEYVAICCGFPPKKNGVIETFIARDPSNRKRFKAIPLDSYFNTSSCGNISQDKTTTNTNATPSAKYAKTLYHLVSTYGNYSLIRVRLKTGRTHQIRVHLKQLGCPILGDPLYGKKDMLFPHATLMLHSRLLAIRLPNQQKLTCFKARIPNRFKEIIKILKQKYNCEYKSVKCKK